MHKEQVDCRHHTVMSKNSTEPLSIRSTYSSLWPFSLIPKPVYTNDLFFALKTEMVPKTEMALKGLGEWTLEGTLHKLDEILS